MAKHFNRDIARKYLNVAHLVHIKALTTNQAVVQYGLTRMTLYRTTKIINDATPDMIKAVAAGDVALNTAYRLVALEKMTPDQQREFLELRGQKRRDGAPIVRTNRHKTSASNTSPTSFLGEKELSRLVYGLEGVTLSLTDVNSVISPEIPTETLKEHLKLVQAHRTAVIRFVAVLRKALEEKENA